MAKSKTENDTTTQDGNVQEMPVADKSHPTLAATEEAQDVANLNRIVVPVPAYLDPSNPIAQSGSINLALDKHPVTHDESYGQVETETFGADEVEGVIDTHAAELAPEEEEASENRDEWTKADWVARAKELGIPSGGNMDTVQTRVEEHEEAVESDKTLSDDDWVQLVQDANSDSELDEIEQRYRATDNDYPSVNAAIDQRRSELAG